MDDDEQIDANLSSSREKRHFLKQVRLYFQSVISRFQYQRHWVLFLVFGLSCLAFFIGDFISSSYTGDSLMASAKVTISFGTSLGLIMVILVIFFTAIGPFSQEVHRSVVTPIAFHLWRYRWIYTLVTIFAFGVVVFVNFDDSFLLAETAVFRFLYSVALLYLMSLTITFPISISYAIALKRWLWVAAIFVFPPISSVFFFYGERYTTRRGQYHISGRKRVPPSPE